MIAALLLWMSWFLGPILAYAAIAKTVQFKRFKNQVVGLGGIRPFLSWPITLALLAGEYILAVLFMTGIGTKVAFFSTGGLLAIFTIFVGWVLFSGKNISCYCFGEDDVGISFITLVRNLGLLGLALVGASFALYQDLVWFWPESIFLVVYGLSSALLFLTAYQLATLWSISRTFV